MEKWGKKIVELKLYNTGLWVEGGNWNGTKWLGKTWTDRKKGGHYLRGKDPITREKVEYVLQKVRETCPWKFCVEITPGIVWQGRQSHVTITFKLKWTKIKQNQNVFPQSH